MNLRVQSPNSRCSLSNNVEANYERRRAIGLPPINELHKSRWGTNSISSRVGCAALSAQSARGRRYVCSAGRRCSWASNLRNKCIGNALLGA